MRKKVILTLLLASLLLTAIMPAASAASKSKPRYTEAEIRMVASLVVLEAGNQSDEGQKAVVQVVLNRRYSGRHGNSLEDVVYRKSASGGYDFTPAPRIEDTEPTARALSNVRAVLLEGDYVLPYYVMYFRNGRYHNGSKYAPYAQIDSHYFSYNPADKPEDWEEDIIGPPPGVGAGYVDPTAPQPDTDDGADLDPADREEEAESPTATKPPSSKPGSSLIAGGKM